MKKLAIALAIVFGLNLVSPVIGNLAKVSYADDDPQPSPQPPSD